MDILTESRSHDFVCLLIICQFYFCKVCKHFFRCQVCSEKCIDLLRFERNSGWLSYFAAYIYHSAYNFACAKFFHKLACSVDSCLCIIRIKTFLKFTGSICSQTDSLGRKTDVCSIKACCFEKNCLYIVCDHRIFATHDTCDADCFLTVADHQYLIIHGTFLTIKCHEFLIIFCTAYNDFFACNCIQVIRMHWLTELFHYIVCNIYKVVDRADSVGSQTSLHPFRGRSDLNILYNSCAVTWAELWILYCNFYIIRSFLIISFALYYRRTELLAKSSCCFSCNSKYAITIYTIGCNLIFKYNVIQSQCFDSTLTYNSIFRENIDSIFRCFRIHFSCASQFFD